jgi:uncharacterized 2Fe-2S/4Fe-4S cluster protein (DUF4445 family)/uncharacterized glyoxalase superfamily protein PhnB
MKFNKLIPELSVSNFKKSLEFYTKVLGFEIEYQRLESKFAFLSFQGSQIMIEEVNDNWNTGKLEYPFGRGVNFQIEVDNINPLLNSLKKNNYPIKMMPKENWYRKDDVLLGNKEFLVACAASAGPAFEGSGVTCGMRASRGAIQKIKIGLRDFEVSFNTIGDMKPRGICGSGYIDLLAEMLRAGIIDKSGKIKAKNSKCIRQGEAGKEFVVAFKEESDSTSDIVITEADVENLKRAKAAIYSATAILVKHMHLDFSSIKKIFIAGGFGTYVDVNNAINIGLLADVERERFVFVGNSALAGARQVLLSYEATKIANEIAKKTTCFELSVDPAYMDEYMAALFFPHTDLALFPSFKNY